MKSIVKYCRSTVLRMVNQNRLRQCASSFPSTSIPVVFIVTPDVCHFTPFFLRNIPTPFQPVLVLNGVSDSDADWIAGVSKGVPVVRLLASLRRDSNTLVPHPDVINGLFAVINQDFCIQDPDCFVTDPQFWSEVSLLDDEFAAGPFWERCECTNLQIPQTFFLLLNANQFRRMEKSYGINAGVCRHLSRKASLATSSIGYDHGRFPRKDKDYFDTLQAYWAVCYSEGLKFKEVIGAQRNVFHIGGTSYLLRGDVELSYGEFWPLSVHYFNLRILERDELKVFRARYEILFNLHGSADNLLDNWPDFRACWRSTHIDSIIAGFS